MGRDQPEERACEASRASRPRGTDPSPVTAYPAGEVPALESATDGRGGRHAASALVCTTVGVLPMALLGGLGPLIRADMGFDAWWIGFGVATAFAAAALASVHGGRLADRLGSRRALWTGVAVSAVSLLGIAVLAHDRVVLAAFLAVGGLGNAIIQPAANLALARGVPVARRGLAFGFKQAAIPAATALGGFSVPVVGVTLGWRAAFVGGAVLALLAAALPVSTAPLAHGHSRRPSFAIPRSLWLIAGGIALASAAANAMAAYLVESAIVAGWETGQAGLFLGAGSILGMLSRLMIGWLTDRMTSGWLRLVANLMILGALGFGSLAFMASPVLLAVGVSVGFAAGWGHNGLLLYAVVRLHPEAPAAATGVTQSGAFAGPVIGPPLFGVIAATWSYGLAWGTVAVMSALAGLLVHLARRQVVRERAAG